MPSHLPDIIGAVLFGVLLQSLIRLHRLKEWHHGYYGAALCLDVAVFGWSAWFAWLGVALLLDDTVQHAVEAFGRRPRMADFTPIHRLGAWIMGLKLKDAGIWLPLAIGLALFAAAIFCAAHFGV
jgi:hypothetical protein